MKIKFWLVLLLLPSLYSSALAQAPQATPATQTSPSATEKTVSRHATAANGELVLYSEPSTSSKSFKLFGKRPIHVYSEVDSVWYRAVHDGAQVFVKRADVILAPEAGRTAGTKSSTHKPARRR